MPFYEELSVHPANSYATGFKDDISKDPSNAEFNRTGRVVYVGWVDPHKLIPVHRSDKLKSDLDKVAFVVINRCHRDALKYIGHMNNDDRMHNVPFVDPASFKSGELMLLCRSSDDEDFDVFLYVLPPNFINLMNDCGYVPPQSFIKNVVNLYDRAYSIRG